MITGMNHVALVVRNLDEALKMYQTSFGLKASKIETVPEQGVKADPLVQPIPLELEPAFPLGG